MNFFVFFSKTGGEDSSDNYSSASRHAVPLLKFPKYKSQIPGPDLFIRIV